MTNCSVLSLRNIVTNVVLGVKVCTVLYVSGLVLVFHPPWCHNDCSDNSKFYETICLGALGKHTNDISSVREHFAWQVCVEEGGVLLMCSTSILISANVLVS